MVNNYFLELRNLISNLKKLVSRTEYTLKLYKKDFKTLSYNIDYFFNKSLEEFFRRVEDILENLKNNISIDLLKESFDDFRNTIEVKQFELVRNEILLLDENFDFKQFNKYDELLDMMNDIKNFYEDILEYFESVLDAYKNYNREKLKDVSKIIDSLDLYNHSDFGGEAKNYSIINEIVKIGEETIRAKDVNVIFNKIEEVDKIVEEAISFIEKESKKSIYDVRLNSMREQLDKFYHIFSVKHNFVL